MEGQQGSQLILISTLIILFFVIILILFIVDQRRKAHSKDAIIDMLEKENKKDINELKEEIKKIREFLKMTANKSESPPNSN